MDREYVEKLFRFDHLPPNLAAVSGEFYKLAMTLWEIVPSNAGRVIAIRDLLTAKDAAVRAVVIGEIKRG